MHIERMKRPVEQKPDKKSHLLRKLARAGMITLLAVPIVVLPAKMAHAQKNMPRNEASKDNAQLLLSGGKITVRGMGNADGLYDLRDDFLSAIGKTDVSGEKNGIWTANDGSKIIYYKLERCILAISINIDGEMRYMIIPADTLAGFTVSKNGSALALLGGNAHVISAGSTMQEYIGDVSAMLMMHHLYMKNPVVRCDSKPGCFWISENGNNKFGIFVLDRGVFELYIDGRKVDVFGE